MDENTFLDSGKLGELLIADTSPGLRKSLTTLEALRRNGNSLDAPVTSEFIGINNVNGLFGLCDGQLSLELEEMFLRDDIIRQLTVAWFAVINKPSKERTAQRE